MRGCLLIVWLLLTGCEIGDDEGTRCDDFDADPCGMTAQCVDSDAGYACQPKCDSNDDCAADGMCDPQTKQCVARDEMETPMPDAAVTGCRRTIRTVGEGLCCDIRAGDGSATNGICLDGLCRNAFSSQENARCAE